MTPSDKGTNILLLSNKETHRLGFNGQVSCEAGECFILLSRCHLHRAKTEHIVPVINYEDFAQINMGNVVNVDHTSHFDQYKILNITIG